MAKKTLDPARMRPMRPEERALFDRADKLPADQALKLIREHFEKRKVLH